jgi:hypothetical protein
VFIIGCVNHEPRRHEGHEGKEEDKNFTKTAFFGKSISQKRQKMGKKSSGKNSPQEGYGVKQVVFLYSLLIS